MEEEVEPAPALRILKMSKTEWHYLLFGTIGAAINGAFPFVFAFLLGEIFGVSSFCVSVLYSTCMPRVAQSSQQAPFISMMIGSIPAADTCKKSQSTLYGKS